MKSIKLFSALCALLAVVAACEQPYDGPDNPAEGGIRLSVAMEDPSTKMSVDDDTGFCKWSTSSSAALQDSVAVWIDGDGKNCYEELMVTVTGQPGSSPNYARIGSVTLNLSGNQTRANYAVFPSTSAVGDFHTSDDLRVVYPTQYDLRGRDADYARMPMVAANHPVDNPNLVFYHVGGLLRIKLPNSEIAGATQVKVTFLGMEHVTGTYKVEGVSGGAISSSSPHTASSPVSGTGNVVTFTLDAVGSAGNTWVNVPLPWGDYTELMGVQVDVSGGGVSKSQVKSAPWPNIARSQGKKMDFDFQGAGTLEYVDLSVREDVTVWKNQTFEVSASAFDGAGRQISGANMQWSSSDENVASVVNSGGQVTVTAVGAGADRKGLATITATCSSGSQVVSRSFTVYVNEATITLNPGELTGRAGKTGKITADVTYTRNGDWSVPRISWSTTAPSYVTVGEASLLPDESNIVNFLAINGSSPAKVKAEIIADNNGTPVTVAGAECVVDIKSAAYVPGKFSVSPTKKVYFASGNVLFKADKSGNNWTNRRWEFAQNQWDTYSHSYMTLGGSGMYVAPYNYHYVDGTDIVIDQFPWAANGVKNVNDKYHYYNQPYVFNFDYDGNDATEETTINTVRYTSYYDTGGDEPQEVNYDLKADHNAINVGPSRNSKGMGIIGINDVLTGSLENAFIPPSFTPGTTYWLDELEGYDLSITLGSILDMNVRIPWSDWTGIERFNGHQFANWTYDWENGGRYCDWGVHFADDGTGSDSKTDGRSWYTLSAPEWHYLISRRSNARLLCGVGMIYDSDKQTFVRGLILLPDNWETPEGCTFLPITTDYGFNIYTASGENFNDSVLISGRWDDMEAAGAVFLPNRSIAVETYGNYDGFRVGLDNQSAEYWTSTCYRQLNRINFGPMNFTFGTGQVEDYVLEYGIFSESGVEIDLHHVRLVHD